MVVGLFSQSVQLQCSQPLSDELVLFQHLRDGPEDCKLGLCKTGDIFAEEKEGVMKGLVVLSKHTEYTACRGLHSG